MIPRTFSYQAVPPSPSWRSQHIGILVGHASSNVQGVAGELIGIEAALVFLLMFLLSVPAILENSHRYHERHQCRAGLEKPEHYAVLVGETRGLEVTGLLVTDEMREATRAYLGFGAERCGWSDLAVRPLFDRNVSGVLVASLTLSDLNSTGFLLSTALGGCQVNPNPNPMLTLNPNPNPNPNPLDGARRLPGEP